MSLRDGQAILPDQHLINKTMQQVPRSVLRQKRPAQESVISFAYTPLMSGCQKVDKEIFAWKSPFKKIKADKQMCLNGEPV